MSSKKSKDPGPGQRSIAAFFSPKSAAKPSEKKRPRDQEAPPQDDDVPILVMDDEDIGAGAGAGAGAGPSTSKPTPSTPSAPIPPSPQPQPRITAARSSGEPSTSAIPPRDPKRHKKMMHKLVEGAGGRGDAEARADRNAQYTFRALQEGGQRGVKHTPLEQQVIAIKQKHPDVILMVETGYKALFFGEDAELASRVCNLYAYPSHNFLTCSVPVPRIFVYVRRLVEAGYKVGVVSQTETAALKSVSASKSKPFDRQLTAVYTRATLEAGELQGDVRASAGSEDSEPAAFSAVASSLNSYILAILESPEDTTTGGGGGGASQAKASRGGASQAQASRGGASQAKASRGGASQAKASRGGSSSGGGGGARSIAVVAVECSTGEVLHAALPLPSDDQRQELEAALLMIHPAEILIDSDRTSRATLALCERMRAADQRVRIESAPAKKYIEGGAIVRLSTCFGEGAAGSGPADADADGDGESPLGNIWAQIKTLSSLEAAALALALDHLEEFGLGRFLLGATLRPLAEAACLTLPANAVRQLDLLSNSATGDVKGSLLHVIDHTLSQGGAREIRRWLTRPLQSAPEIRRRLDAVQELLEDHDLREGLHKLLTRIGDVERGLGRIAQGASAPLEFVSTLRTLHQANTEARGLLEGGGPRAELLASRLKALSDVEVGRTAVAALELLHEDACRRNELEGVFRSEAAFPEIFKLRAAVRASRDALDALLPEFRKALKIPGLQFVSIQNQGDFLIEVPVENPSVPKTWEKVCSTKKMNRFWPPQVKKFRLELQCDEERLAVAAKHSWKQFLMRTAGLLAPLRAAAVALANLDALSALARASGRPGYVRPEILDPSHTPTHHLIQGRHPVLDVMLAGAVVPNDVCLRHAGPRACVITGPNMGGKSVLSRMSAQIQILAQVGCFVPAERFTTTPCDWIFTRMGASDNLLLGSSTFHEELSETALILARATPRSLVLVDELGRGTSTSDGQAVAHATLHDLVLRNQCLALFTTHYQQIAQAVSRELPGLVQPVCMSYREEGAGDGEGGGATLPRIVLLYKAVEGVANRSFGMNVAKMAGLGVAVVVKAEEVSRAFEEEMTDRILNAKVATVRGVMAKIQGAVRGGDVASVERILKGEDEELGRVLKDLDVLTAEGLLGGILEDSGEME